MKLETEGKKATVQTKETEKTIMSGLEPIGAYGETFRAYCEETQTRISTGYLSLDIMLNGGLTNELVILSAETSTGKSAITMSIAQNIAENGTDVLYFALEMGKNEFIARGISAISYEESKKNSSKKPLMTSDILLSTYIEELGEFAKLAYSQYSRYADTYFKRYGEHLYIIESGTKGLTVEDIANTAALYKKQNPGKRVTLFVDYLQLVRADSISDRKSKTDHVVVTLKALASQIGMPVFAISSVSRAKYGVRVSLSSGKESGELEYTAGIVLGWNWRGVTDSDDKSAEEEKKVCRERGYRIMSMEMLKNRNSCRDVSIFFRYRPAYNIFEEIRASELERKPATEIEV